MFSLALFLLGIGLLLNGSNILSDALKRMGSRAFRRMVLQCTTPRWKALTLGLASGVALQSTSAAMMILASLNTVGSVTGAQAMSILTGFSVGNCLMPFLVSLKIRLAVFFLVGVSSIFLYFTKEERLRNLTSVAFALGLIFFGIEMMLDGVRPLRAEPWFSQILTVASQWPGLSILVGGALGFLVQSSTAVVIVAIGLAKGGVLSGHEIFLIMYGAAIGSTLFKSFLGSAISGSGRQLVRFVNLFNLTGAGLFIVFYYIELHLHVPLVMALITRFTPEPALQAAWAFLLLNMTSALIYTTFHHNIASRLARQFPANEEEGLSRLQYLGPVSPEDPYGTLELIGMEQLREFEHVAAFLSSVLEDSQGIDLARRMSAFGMLGREIEGALAEVCSMRIDRDSAQWLAVLQTRQTLIRQLADSTAELGSSIEQARRFPEISGLASACFETIDFLFQYAIELIKTGVDDDESNRLVFYNDRGPQMQQLREAYLNTHQDLTHEARSSLLTLTIGLDKCVWLLGRTLNLETELHKYQIKTVTIQYR
ncbi:MAG: Na/Pi cotransporter family protein [Geobacteraceae bacterium]|nr:Na/Pi cotransporter family protein [Geobacteraceae bacterium]